MMKASQVPDTNFSREEHGGNIEAAKKRYLMNRFLDFSININPWGPPVQLWCNLLLNLAKIKEYPEPYSQHGCELIASFFGRSVEWIALGNGAAELIYQLPRLLPVQRAIILEPTFSEYELAFESQGKPVLKIIIGPEYQVNLDQINDVLQPGDMLFLCQPNNPTGQCLPEKKLSALINMADTKQSWVVLDESFLWFCGSLKEISLACYLERFPRLIIINSLTKIGAIPGLRVGFILAQPKIITLIKAGLNPWNINRITQKAISCLLSERFLKLTRRRLNTESLWLRQQLQKITGLKIYPWDANFYLVQVEHPKLTATDIIKKLGHQGILVRDCSNFNGLDHSFFRVAVGKRRKNLRLLNILRTIMQN